MTKKSALEEMRVMAGLSEARDLDEVMTSDKTMMRILDKALFPVMEKAVKEVEVGIKKELSEIPEDEREQVAEDLAEEMNRGLLYRELRFNIGKEKVLMLLVSPQSH